MGSPTSHTLESESQWVTFDLAGEIYGIDVMQVQEVLRPSPIAPVPGAPHFVLGIVNLRGNVVTVIDTRARFGLAPREADEASRVIIVEAGDMVVGLLVDTVSDVVNVPEEGVETSALTGRDSRSDYIRGVYSNGETLLILVDLEQLLGKDAGS